LTLDIYASGISHDNNADLDTLLKIPARELARSIMCLLIDADLQ
jgi:hypothetical protein